MARAEVEPPARCSATMVLLEATGQTDDWRCNVPVHRARRLVGVAATLASSSAVSAVVEDHVGAIVVVTRAGL